MAASSLEMAQAPYWWRRHWLENCEEFRVERAGEPLGFVESVEWTTGDAPGGIVIEALGATRSIRVSVAEVEDVDPYRCLVTLRPGS